MIESLLKILPAKIIKPILTRLNYEKLYEVRLRSDRPVSVNYGSKFYFLSESGLSGEAGKAITAEAALVSDVVVRATDFSLYAVNDQLKAGFLTIRGGVRIGIAGETVREGEDIKTVKNFSSVNIRIPHEIKGSADKPYKYCCADELRNTLVISPPGAGKTTILRDLARQLGSRNPTLNVLLADERNELAASYRGVPQLDVGLHTDVIASASKAYAFTAGIRALAPDVIITDELAGAADAAAVEYAVTSGVKVIASCHAADHLDVISKPGFESLVKKRLFARFVDLSQKFGAGTCEGIFDADFNPVYV